VRDISERKEIEEQLRLTTERFQTALRGTPMTVFNQDTDLRFTWVYNPVGLHEETQIIGKTDKDLLEPHDAEWSMEIKREVLRTGTPFQGEFAVMMQGKRRHYHVNIDPQRNSRGEIVGLMCSSFDMTSLKMAEAEIAKLARQRQLAIDAAKMGWWRHDIVADVTTWDDTFKTIFGLSANTGSGELFSQRLHPEDRERTFKKYMDAIDRTNPKLYSNEYRLVMEDGSVRWVESHGAPEFEGLGEARKFVAFSGTVQDITARKTAELQRHQTQEAFAKLVENAPYGVYVVDSEFRIALTDPGSRTEAFRNVDPLDGRDFGEVMRILWPEPLASQIIAIFRHTLETGEPYYSERFRNSRRDLGEVKAYEWELHRIVLPDGHYGVVCYYFDSTEMRDTEDALLRQRERADFVGEGSDVGFWFCDLPFDRVIWDKRVKKHFWLPPDDTPVTMEIFYSLLHPDDREPTRQAIENSIKNNQQYDVEYRTIAPDGRQRWVRANGRAFYNEAGKPVRFDGITQDITARKQAEEALKASEARYRELAGTLEQQVQMRTRQLRERSEELMRTSEELQILSGRLLQVQDEERRRIARDLHDSSGQILTAIGLDLANIAESAKSEKIRAIAPQLQAQVEESQKLVDLLHRELRTTTYLLHPPLLDETGLFSAISWYVQGMTQRSGVNIEFDFAQDFGRLSREMELLVFRLVQESMTNIHRHSGSKTAGIRIRRLADAITVEIEDHGRGIQPEKLAEIESGVSGLGIRAMRERLRQFGGELKIQSNGSGTRVFVTIPLVQTSAAASGIEPVEAAI
jgi:PAS domain S-box-containing protein